MIDNLRLMHSVAVARKMRELAVEIYNNTDIEKDMFTLGFLHDIGYEFAKNNEEHAMIGGDMLKNQNYKYWKEVYFHGMVNAPYSSEYLDLLNKADLVIDRNGNEVGVERRIKGISYRYGEDSEKHINAKLLAHQLKLI